MQSKWHFSHSEKKRLSGLPRSLKVSAVLLGEQWWVTARESLLPVPNLHFSIIWNAATVTTPLWPSPSTPLWRLLRDTLNLETPHRNLPFWLIIRQSQAFSPFLHLWQTSDLWSSNGWVPTAHDPLGALHQHLPAWETIILCKQLWTTLFEEECLFYSLFLQNKLNSAAMSKVFPSHASNPYIDKFSPWHLHQANSKATEGYCLSSTKCPSLLGCRWVCISSTAIRYVYRL